MRKILPWCGLKQNRGKTRRSGSRKPTLNTTMRKSVTFGCRPRIAPRLSYGSGAGPAFPSNIKATKFCKQSLFETPKQRRTANGVRVSAARPTLRRPFFAHPSPRIEFILWDLAAGVKLQSRISSIMKSHLFQTLGLRGLTLTLVFCGVTLGAANCSQVAAAPNSNPSQDEGLKPILQYIASAWDTLTRSMSECQSLVDPKIKVAPVLYLPAGFTTPIAVQKLARECDVRIEHLPLAVHRLGEVDTAKIQPHGLLYLENKYVVPGGRFNEMYGWDSYFIIRGLLQAGRVELARGMVDNFFFEVEHYGAMLNANRTYYLTRSQPPFLSSMFVDVYRASHKDSNPDKAWLERAYTDLNKDYEMWTHDPHLAGQTGLSRYYDFGEGPPAEAVQDESGFYRKVAQYFFLHPTEAEDYVVEMKPGTTQLVAGSPYSLQVCDAP